ncbi:hypothetical protein CCUS01_02046 [Colletotrichum cuscutae]|uniref:Uncharacterized protein n=1 Tax=Colletotrichum cuscutae TaxID=1209917 RepID=A0AAI9U793_9PEZI|nr:hypothetical protein CCUS01_02046 [Colletotrichum cuscutae]
MDQSDSRPREQIHSNWRLPSSDGQQAVIATSTPASPASMESEKYAYFPANRCQGIIPQ